MEQLTKKAYQLVNGTSYHAETNPTLISILENLRANETRCFFVFGDTTTGRSWEEENDVVGRIGISTGQIKIPLLIHNKRSLGGGSLLDHCIIGIRRSNVTDGQWIYRNSKSNFDMYGKNL